MVSTPLWGIILVIFACILNALGALYFKKCSGELKLNFKSLFNKNLIIGGLLYLFSTILFLPALKHGELSVLYPFVATSYIWVIIFSKMQLNEKISLYKWIGIILILIGVSFIGKGI